MSARRAVIKPAPEASQPSAESVEIEIDDRRGVQRQRLTNDQAADDRNSQWMTQFGAFPGAESQRQRAEQSGESRHHDRPEAQHAGLENRLGRRQAASLRLKREVD